MNEIILNKVQKFSCVFLFWYSNHALFGSPLFLYSKRAFDFAMWTFRFIASDRCRGDPVAKRTCACRIRNQNVRLNAIGSCIPPTGSHASGPKHRPPINDTGHVLHHVSKIVVGTGHCRISHTRIYADRSNDIPLRFLENDLIVI